MTRISGVADPSFSHAVTSDSTGIYYTGQYSGPTVTIYDAPGTSSSLSSISVPSSNRINILVKYSFSGQAIWFTKCVGNLTQYEIFGLFSYKNSIFWNFQFPANTTISLYDSQNNLQYNVTNSDTDSYNCLIRYDDSGNIIWSIKYTAGRGASIYNDNILINSIGVQASFYDVNGNIVKIYGDDIPGTSIFIARYGIDGILQSTRKITGGFVAISIMVLSNKNYIGLRTQQGTYRVYDTGSDSKYQTIQTGNFGSVYVKVSGATI
jgi:hypothetical protein